MTHPRIAVLLSGSGTTLQNLIDRIADGSLPANIVQVVSSKPDVKGIDKAKAAGLPVEVVQRKAFPSVEAFSEVNFDVVRRSGADLVCLAGFLAMLKLPADFRGRVLNIHPSLLPKFGGKGMFGHHVHEAVLNAGEAESGCTVHFVDDEYDHGEVLLQRRCPVLQGDTPAELAKRVFEQECLAYPEGIRLWTKLNRPSTP